MEKERQVKILSIIVLVIAIVGMSLGFAAFSVSLKIESSATVTPNPDDFKMVIYGWGEECSDTQWNCTNDMYKSAPAAYGGEFGIATINNENGTISNISASYTSFDYYTNIYESFYWFKLQNEGKYDIYLNQSDLIGLGSNSVRRICKPVGDTSKELVDAACSNISMYARLYQVVDNKLETATSLKIKPGQFLMTQLIFDYDNKSLQPDGPFEIKFDDIKINYSTREN